QARTISFDMKAASPLSFFLRDVFPNAGPELLRLYEAAAENTNLLHTDFYTIRDLMELSGYTTQEPLQALLLVMLLALDEGSLCVEASEASLARRLGDLIGEADARSWAASMVSSLREPGFSELIGERVDDGKPVVIRRLGPRTYLYFQKYLKYELALQAELRKHLGSGEVSHAPGQQLGAGGQPLSTILNNVED